MSKDNLTFKEFVQNQNLVPEISTTLQKSITTSMVTSTSLTPSKAIKFKGDLISGATSPETISEISDLIGKPKDNESEDEFVNRSMDRLATFFTKKFK